MRPSRRQFAPLVVYVILFHTFWMWGFVFWIYPWMRTLGDTTLRYAVVNITLRFLVWVLSVFLFLRYIDRVDPIAYLKLKENLQRGVVIGIVVSLINFFGTMMRFGTPHLSLKSLTWNSVISTSFLIGVFEEIPYRGFILQKFEERYGFWIATLMSSLLFLSIHVPG